MLSLCDINRRYLVRRRIWRFTLMGPAVQIDRASSNFKLTPQDLNIRLWPLPQGTAERFVNASVSISLHIILPHITQLSFSIWNLISLGVIGSKPSFPQPYLRYLYIETWIHSFDLCLLFRFFTNHIETKEKNTATKDTSTAQ